MTNCGVYKISFPSGNCYIGSSNQIKRRILAHKRALKNGCHINQALQNAYNKYGKDQIEISILMETEIDDLRVWEQFFIDKYQPSYNISKSAECALFDKDVVSKRVASVSRPVKCLSTGKIYKSGYDAARDVGCEILKNQIYTAIKNEYLFAGMFWCYADELKDVNDVKNRYNQREIDRKKNASSSSSDSRSRAVIRLSDNKVFKSAAQASTELGLVRTAIFDACRYGQKKADSYWCYADNPITHEQAEESHQKKLLIQKQNQIASVVKRQSIPVINFATNERFLSIEKAAESLGIRADKLSKLIKEQKTINGQLWGFNK